MNSHQNSEIAIIRIAKLEFIDQLLNYADNIRIAKIIASRFHESEPDENRVDIFEHTAPQRG